MITLDVNKGRQVAKPLYEAFATTGILGSKTNPEDLLPRGVSEGSPEHVCFLTLTVSIDYQRSAHALWQSAARTYEDPETSYLFEPAALYTVSFQKVKQDMRKYGLSLKPHQDAWIWQTVGVTFH